GHQLVESANLDIAGLAPLVPCFLEKFHHCDGGLRAGPDKPEQTLGERIRTAQGSPEGFHDGPVPSAIADDCQTTPTALLDEPTAECLVLGLKLGGEVLELAVEVVAMKLDSDRPILILDAVRQDHGVRQVYDGHLAAAVSACLNFLKGSLNEGVKIRRPDDLSLSKGEKPCEAVMALGRFGAPKPFVQKGSTVPLVGQEFLVVEGVFLVRP